MKNNCRLLRNCAALIAFAACAVLFVSCDNMDWPSYTVAFNPNGGTGTVPSSQTVNARSSIRIPGGAGLSRSGYVFVGWNTNSAGTGTDFSEGDTFTPAGSTTLFARWLTAVDAIIVNPPSANVARGGTQNFSATVLGAMNPPQTVTWTIDEAGRHAQTMINASGVLSVAADESLTMLTVRATSTFDTSVSGTATVTVPIPVVTGVTVSPSSSSVARGGTQNFAATVLGANSPPQTVTWTIDEAGRHAQTTINASGVLSVAADESLGTLTVRATSTFDISVSGTATVTVPIPVVTGLTVSPSSSSVARDGTENFTATVLGVNDPPQTVTWSIDEAGRHVETAINTNGVLTVAADESLGTLTVRATSTFDTSVSGTATVTVLIPVVTGVTVSPATATIPSGGSANFTATVLGDNNPPLTVTWSIDEAGRNAQTSINHNGVLLVAATESISVLTVRATSTLDTSISGTATVNVLRTDLDGNVIVPGTNLASQLDWVRNNAQSSGRYLIEISGHEVLSPQTLPTDRTNLTVTLRGIGIMRTVNLIADGSIFTVDSGVTLVLDNNVTLEGRNNAAHGWNNRYPLIQVNQGGTLVMNAGSRATGNTNTTWSSTYFGGGVRVNSGGMFYMHGGEISGNTCYSSSGGVHVASGGTFRMSGGVIYGNEWWVPEELRNTGGWGSAALFNAGIAQHGTFSLVGGFVSEGLLSSTRYTIRF